jgi:hypothetical protein
MPVLTWPRALLGCAVALLLGCAVGYRLRPPPRVETHETVRTVTEYRDRDVVRTVAGPERVVERWRTSAPPPVQPPGCLPCPACEEHERVIERGPVVTEESHDVASHAETHAAASSVTTPTLPPGWSLGAAAMVSRGGLGWQAGIGRRMLGPVWLEVQASTVPSASVGVRVEF